MNNSIYKIGWPFRKYCILVPQEMDFDIFEWLYIQLMIYFNNSYDAKDIYNEQIKEKIYELIQQNFSEIINDQILNYVSYSVENKYIKKVNNTYIIDRAAYKYLNTYSTLFSNNLTIKYFFQDLITGEIFPYFYSQDEIDGTIFKQDRENKISPIIPEDEKPSKSKIERAYNNSINLNKQKERDSLHFPSLEVFNEMVDDRDKTITTDFCINESKNTKDCTESSNDIRDINDQQEKTHSNIIFLDKCIEPYFLEVKISLDNNEFYCISPFDKYSNILINKCFKYGCNTSEELSKLYNKLSEEYLIVLPENSALEIIEKTDFASNLKYCKELYRLIEPLSDKNLANDVRLIDRYCEENNSDYYNRLGLFLEALVGNVKYKESSKEERQKEENEYSIQKIINNKLNIARSKAQFRITKHIFGNWKDKYSKQEGIYHSFSGELLDIVLKTDIISSEHFYNEFFNDVFDVYNSRSHYGSHGKGNKDTNSEIIGKLVRITKVFLDIIK